MSPIRVVPTREKGLAPAQSGTLAMCTYGPDRRLPLCYPPAAASEDRREAEPRATHGPGPARLRAAGGGGRRGGAARELAAEAPGGPERGSCVPTPAPARYPRHSPEGLARWRQRRRQTSAICERLSLPPCLPSSLRCTLGNAVPPALFSGIGALGENYSSRRAMRGGPDTASSAGGEAKPGREAAGASP